MNQLYDIFGKLLRAPRTIYRIVGRKCRAVFGYIYRRICEIFCFVLFHRAEKRAAKKDVLNVVFFVVFESTWKVDSVYKAMLADKRFNPIILICPVMDHGWDNMLIRMKEAYSYFVDRGYQNVYRAYDEQTKKYIDVRKEFKPDIIFYTNPYKGLIDNRYYIDKFPDILTCYVPYFFTNMVGDFTYNLPFHNKLWRFYVENDEMVQFYNQRIGYERMNHKAVGYPAFDEYDSIIPPKKNNYKYIIWAPHHSINQAYDLHRTSFLCYHKQMLEWVEKYKDSLFVIFRPHPLLKNKLYNYEGWGVEKTNEYYQCWNTLPNAMLSENRDYLEDFMLSDAIIHDCGSFTVEYLYTEKPAMFTGEKPKESDMSMIAYKALDCYEIARTKEDMEEFIIRVIKGETDALSSKKRLYKEMYLRTLNGVKASDNIMHDICSTIGGKFTD